MERIELKQLSVHILEPPEPIETGGGGWGASSIHGAERRELKNGSMDD